MNSTIFKSTYFWATHKRPKTHFDEILVGVDAERWEPLHRLDFETSGLILFGIKEESQKLRSIFQNNPETEKLYLAGASTPLPHFLEGEPVKGFTGERYRSSKKVKFSLEKDKLHGFRQIREAHQIAKSLEKPQSHIFKGHLYEVRLITGARHQIRAFFSAFEAPLVGDTLYGGPAAPRLELHSWKLQFKCPISGETHSLEATL